MVSLSIQERKAEFERHISEKIYESVKLTFLGIDGFDVYNCSIPFRWEGKEYIYGRVEKREEWARSWSGYLKKPGRTNTHW